MQWQQKALLLRRQRKVFLTSADHRAEDVRVHAFVVTELKLRSIQTHDQTPLSSTGLSALRVLLHLLAEISGDDLRVGAHGGGRAGHE